MDYATLPPDLRELAAAVPNPNDGFFGPHSYAWRLLRENTIQLGGPYAALMQVAHPLVAQGVASHSNYRGDPVGRLQRTFRAVHAIVFGTVDDALAAALHSRRMHKPVHGAMPTETGEYHRGDRYHANRSDLLLWVHATLVEGAILSHERFIRPLTREERFGLYEEFKTFGRLFGIPYGDYPPDYADFSAYYADMVAEHLAVSPAGADVARNIVYNAGYYRAISPLIVLLAAGMLPPNVRAQFGLPWNRGMALALDQFSKHYRRVRSVQPDVILYRKAYLRALARTGAEKPPRDGLPLPELLAAAFR